MDISSFSKMTILHFDYSEETIVIFEGMKLKNISRGQIQNFFSKIAIFHFDDCGKAIEIFDEIKPKSFAEVEIDARHFEHV